MTALGIDWDRETRLLATPLGLPGSGRIRYGAAMQFHRAGRISAATLEAYRIASANDRTDPALLLADRGLALVETTPLSPEQTLTSLFEASLDYLSRLTGPGVTEARQALARQVPGPLPPPQSHPAAIAHLPSTLASLTPDEPALAAAIAAANPHLHWTSDLQAIEGSAYAPITCPDPAIEFGLLITPPGQRFHSPHPRLYAPLTGPHLWQLAPDTAPTLRLAHFPIKDPHLLETGPLPLLALLVWTAP